MFYSKAGGDCEGQRRSTTGTCFVYPFLNKWSSIWRGGELTIQSPPTVPSSAMTGSWWENTICSQPSDSTMETDRETSPPSYMETPHELRGGKGDPHTGMHLQDSAKKTAISRHEAGSRWTRPYSSCSLFTILTLIVTLFVALVGGMSVLRMRELERRLAWQEREIENLDDRVKQLSRIGDNYLPGLEVGVDVRQGCNCLTFNRDFKTFQS